MRIIQLILCCLLLCEYSLAQDTETVSIPVSKDATIKSDAPGANFGQETDVIVEVNSDEERVQRSLLHFDVFSASIPENAYIISAFLNLRGIEHTEENSSNESLLQFLQEEWEENEVTWESQPFAGQENQIEITSQGNTANNISIDLTDWFRVNHAGANEIENFGFLLRLNEEDGVAKLSFHSNESEELTERPTLEVVYRIPSDLIFSITPSIIEKELPNEGVIETKILQGDGPFQFQWSTNVSNSGNESIVGGLTAGTYTLTVTDDNQVSETKAIGLGYGPNWNVENSNYYIYQSGILKKLTTNNWYGLAESENVLTSPNGWIEYTVRSYTGRKMIGFGLANESGSNTWTAIGYGMYLNANTQVVLASNGSLTIIGDYTPGDILRVVKNGANFSIEKNGLIIPSSSRIISSLDVELRAKSACYDLNTKIENLRLSFGDLLEIDMVSSSLSSETATDGVLRVIPSCGTGPYTYQWSNGETTDEIDNLGDAIYHVTVTDANGLTEVAHGTISYVDDAWNWEEERTFDNDGKLIAASKTYFDGLKNRVQSQSKLIEENSMMVSQTIYDKNGRAAITTLPAPNFQGGFAYQYNFIKSSDGADYNADKFDLPITSSNYLGEVNQPYQVAKNEKGSLGWYYSNNNDVEPYVATTAYPYSRTEFSSLTGQARRSSVPHDQLRMGSGRETESYKMPVAGELSYFFGFAEGWKLTVGFDNGNILDLGSEYLKIPGKAPELPFIKRAVKTIQYDQDGKESIIFEDLDGHLIATALSGLGDDGSNINTFKVSSIIENVTPGSYVDIHIPQGCETSLLSFEKILHKDYSIFDLRTDEEIYSNVDGSTSSVSLQPGVYRIVDNYGQYTTTISYELNYHQIALNYYDLKGRLVATVSPEGFDDQFDLSGMTTSTLDQAEDFDYINTGASSADLNFLNPTDPATPTKVEHVLQKNTNPDDGQYTNFVVYIAEKLDPPALVSNDISSGEVPMLPGNINYPEGGVTPEGEPATESIYVGASSNGISSIGSNRLNAQGGIGSGSLAGNTGNDFDWDPNDVQVPCGKAPTHKRWYQFNLKMLAVEEDGTETELRTGKITAYRSYSTFYNSPLEWRFSGDDDSWQQGDALINDGILTRNVPGILLFSIGNNLSQNIDNVRIKIENIVAKENQITHTLVGQAHCFSERWVDYYDYSEVESDLQLRIKSLTTNYSHNSIVPDHDINEVLEYNNLGQVKAKILLDEGKTEYLYTRDGRLRFSQNEVQRNAIPKRFSYTNYDSQGRVIETGEALEGNVANLRFPTTDVVNVADVFVSDPNILEVTETINLTESEKVEPSKFYYNTKLAQSVMSANYPYLLNNGYEQTYTWQQLSYSENINSMTIYSYDVSGRVKWQAKVLRGTDDGTGHEIIKTKDFTYTDKGQLESVTYQKNNPTEYFEHFYIYDKSARLKKAYTRSASGAALVEEAEYHYYLHGPLKRVELANNLQGVDYIYNTLGYLKAINSPNIGSTHPKAFKDPGNDNPTNNGFEEDAFGMSLDYFNGDYTRQGTYINYGEASTPSYNGTINAVRWNTASNLAPTNQQWIYKYAYNKNNWLTEAKFGTYNFGCHNPGINDDPLSCSGIAAPNYDANSSYLVDGITYDKIGNIQSLRRRANSGLLMDDFTYHYSPDKVSCLAHLSDAASNGAITDDLDDQGSFTLSTMSSWNYEYDAMGRMTLDKAQNQKLVYNGLGLVKEVLKENAQGVYIPIVRYFYDENGARLAKTSYDNSGSAVTKEWYLGGIKIQEDLIASTENYIYDLNATGRIGSFNKTGGLKTYELNDHLGNVRATVIKNIGNMAILSFADYYPFGSEMPGRNFVSGDEYEHGFQGQFTEKDEEVNWDAFQLRMWDGRLARWTSIDPARQFASPYVGMGNNPINGVDPDGGIWHIVAGGVIGGIGAAISLALEPGDIDWTSSRTWAKIGTGAATGAAIAAVPFSAVAVGTGGSLVTVTGVSTSLIGSSLAAGSIAFTGNLVDQGIDIHYSGKDVTDISNYNFEKAALSGVTTAVTFGVAGRLTTNLNYSATHQYWAGASNSFTRSFYKAPNIGAAAVNSGLEPFNYGANSIDWTKFSFFGSGGSGIPTIQINLPTVTIQPGVGVIDGKLFDPNLHK